MDPSDVGFDVAFQTFAIMNLNVSPKWLKDDNKIVRVQETISEDLLAQVCTAFTWQHHFLSGVCCYQAQSKHRQKKCIIIQAHLY